MSYESQSLEELMADVDADFADLMSDMGDDSEAMSAEFQELEAILLDTPELAGFEEMSFGALASDDPVEAQADLQFLGSLIKGKAKKLIAKLVALVKKKGPKAANCAKLLIKAIAAFKSGKFLTALRLAYKVYQCLKNL